MNNCFGPDFFVSRLSLQPQSIPFCQLPEGFHITSWDLVNTAFSPGGSAGLAIISRFEKNLWSWEKIYSLLLKHHVQTLPPYPLLAWHVSLSETLLCEDGYYLIFPFRGYYVKLFNTVSLVDIILCCFFVGYYLTWEDLQVSFSWSGTVVFRGWRARS